jgi:hypothetical protein
MAEHSSEGRRPAMKPLRRIGIGTVLALGLLHPLDRAAGEDLTSAIQTGRMTVVEIDRGTRRIVCMNSFGRIYEHKVTTEAKVVADDRTTTDLKGLSAGDVIKADIRAGQIRRIVVLRHAWHDTTSQE